MKKPILKESPDSIPKNLTYDKYGDPYVNYADLDYNDDDPDEEYVNFDSYDAHAFWVDGDEVIMSKSTETHPYRIKRNILNYPGRIWVNAKIISFWYYPDNKKLRWILERLNGELDYYYPDKKIDLLSDEGWLIEVPKTRNKELPWKAYDYFESELLPIGEYDNDDIDNSYARSEEDLAQQHVLSPLLKQKQFKKGWGSNSTRYINNRIWQMAAPVSDNYNIDKNLMQSLYEFERGVDPMKTLGIGLPQKIKELKELIHLESTTNPWVESVSEYDAIIKWDNSFLKPIYDIGERATPLELSAIKIILSEIISKPKGQIADLLSRGSFFKLLYNFDLLSDKLITASNFNVIRSVLPEEVWEPWLDKQPANTIFTIGISTSNRNFLKKAIRKGATNVDIGNSEALNLAAIDSDVELAELLLPLPGIDPTLNTKKGKRYDMDDSHFPIRRAAKNGCYQLVKLLMDDGRSDPSYKDNWALSAALAGGFTDIVKLLLTDDRVKFKIDRLNATAKKRLNKIMAVKESMQQSNSNIKHNLIDELEEYREEDEEIIKSFYVQDIMSPVIFDKEEETYVMRSDIKTKLLNINSEFLDFIGIDFDVEDIILTGSLANFNWSKYSDVDLHIIIDFSNTKHNVELLKELFDAKKNIWNSQHNILVAGYEVELYVQDSSETHSSSGIYSLMKDAWLVEPSPEKYDIDENLILEKGDDYMKIIDELVGEFEMGVDVTDEVSRVQNKIKKFRKSGLESGGEYSYENLTFKLLRRNGYIKRLFDLKRDIIDKKLSLK